MVFSSSSLSRAFPEAGGGLRRLRLGARDGGGGLAAGPGRRSSGRRRFRSLPAGVGAGEERETQRDRAQNDGPVRR